MESRRDWLERLRNRVVFSVFYPKKVIPYLVKSSYSQSGEDSIVVQVLGKIPKLYVDIGCGHPINGSNTFKFYQKGARGLCIDANPKFRFIYKLFRSRDIFLIGGISLADKESQHFYRFIEDVYSTFDPIRAQNLINRGLVLKGTESIPLINLRKVIVEFFNEGPYVLDFLNVDVEGLDLVVVENFPFDICSPKVICIEEWDNPINERTVIRSLLESKGYTLAGYSGISSIYSLGSK